MTYELDNKFVKFLGPGSNPAGWEVSSLLYPSEEDLPFGRIILHAQCTSHSLCHAISQMALMKIMGHLRDVKEGKATVGG